MPIDSSPEGNEILHQAIVKSFPTNTDKNKVSPLGVKTPEGESARDLDTEDSRQGLPHGSLNEAWLVKPPLGN